MILFLKWLKEVHHEIYHDRAGYNKTDAIDLIWDMYPSHRTDLIKRLCDSYNIRIHYIPAGATDLLQPLDKSVFGPLKMKARKEWIDRYASRLEEVKGSHNSPDLKEANTKKAAVELLRDVWENLENPSIEKEWLIYANNDINPLLSLSTEQNYSSQHISEADIEEMQEADDVSEEEANDLDDPLDGPNPEDFDNDRDLMDQWNQDWNCDAHIYYDDLTKENTYTSKTALGYWIPDVEKSNSVRKKGKEGD